MRNGALFFHALQAGHFSVAAWVFLRQRWLLALLNVLLPLTSWAVVSLGVTLITFTVVFMTRNVVPVLTTPGTVPYMLLQGLVLLISFNIYMNYFCSITFSRRVGKAPAAYRYRDVLDTHAADAPVDDSDCSEMSDAENTGDHPHDGLLGAGGAQEMNSVTCDVSAARCACVFPVNSGVVTETSFTGTFTHSLAPRLPLPAAARRSEEGPLTLSLAGILDTTTEGAVVKDRAGDASAAATARLSQQDRVAAGRRGGMRSMLARFMSLATYVRSLSSGCSRLCAFFRFRRSVVAPLETLLELEEIASVAERYPAWLRMIRVLDSPRRYCRHCRRLKAPREHHCTVCNECVSKMDHHCPWINNCVDAENQRYFLLFVWWLWVGTLLASAFMAYGYWQQSSSVQKLRHLHGRWKTLPNKAAAEAELRSQRMPYGPPGVLLTSHLAVLTLCITVMICFCMSFFLWFNQRLVFENTTAIEIAAVDERRNRVYRDGGFTYRSPYDLGAWHNFLDLFTLACDPFVKMIHEAEMEADRKMTSSLRKGFASSRGQRWIRTGKFLAQRVCIVLWLTLFPSLRPISGDGVHFLTYDSIVPDEVYLVFAA